MADRFWEEFHFRATLAWTSAIYSQRYRPGSRPFCNIDRWRIVHSAALRTNRGDKFSRACGPERVVKRAQPLAVGSAVSSPTSDKQFDILSSSARLGERFFVYRRDSMSAYCYMVLIDRPWFVLLIGMYSSIGRPVFSHSNSRLHGQRSRCKLVQGSLPLPGVCITFPPLCWPSRPANGRVRSRN